MDKFNDSINIAILRIKNELDELIKLIKKDVFPKNIKASPQSDDKGINYFKWNVEFLGRKDTIWENYKIEGKLIFNEHYPFEPPIFEFEQGFQHIHVYSDGKVCLNLISPDYWDFQTSVSSILINIEDLIHKQPNIQSPVNTELSELYLSDQNKYEEAIRKNVNFRTNNNQILQNQSNDVKQYKEIFYTNK